MPVSLVYVFGSALVLLSSTNLTSMLIEVRRTVKKNYHFFWEGVKLGVSLSERNVGLGSYF